MPRQLSAALLGAFLIFGLNAVSADNAYDFGDVFPDDAGKVSFDLAAWCDVDGHRIYLERTPLREVIRVLGGGHLQRTGDAGAANFDYFVNYTDGADLITFSSNNDMGGPEHATQGVAIRQLRPYDRGESLPRLHLPIRFPFGLSNIAFSKLSQELGSARVHNGVCAYSYSTKYQKHDAHGHWMVDLYASLEVRLLDDRITAISVDHFSESE